ncbi:MAG: 2-hydroxyacyl-CoA dehydratase [Thermodesulfobacteriota bacterium]|nr:2-hydroxyacyl-CoA dehydratase [Thermodesulfobacteriota bacterium]
MISESREWYENRHEYVRKWKKKTGRKVLGYFCTYVPEEILYAADILPVRILGSHEPSSITEAHLFAMYCPFCRDCLAQGLEGRYDYLDGIMISESCLHIRQTYSSWKEHVPVNFAYILPMPAGLQSRLAAPFLKKELEKFIREIEQWTGKKIGEADLVKGTEIVNTNRRLMKEVYELRKSDTPPITGLESMYMVIGSQLGDKREQNTLIEQALSGGFDGRLADRDPGQRLMIIGSEDDDTEFVYMVEQVGSTIVCDDHCTGSRYFWDEVDMDSDPLLAIAERYVTRTPCPSKDWPELRRFQRIMNFIREYRVDGAIVIQQKFCDPHECDKVALLDMLKQNDIPALYLEFDVTAPIGPLRIRVDAFLETLAGEDLF